MHTDENPAPGKAGEQTLELPKLLTAAPLAKAVNVSTSRIYQLARDGVIPCVRIGRQVRFDPARVAVWLAQGGSR
jgi:excisionase family DNA binding protein